MIVKISTFAFGLERSLRSTNTQQTHNVLVYIYSSWMTPVSNARPAAQVTFSALDMLQWHKADLGSDEGPVEHGARAWAGIVRSATKVRLQPDRLDHAVRRIRWMDGELVEAVRLQQRPVFVGGAFLGAEEDQHVEVEELGPIGQTEDRHGTDGRCNPGVIDELHERRLRRQPLDPRNYVGLQLRPLLR